MPHNKGSSDNSQEQNLIYELKMKENLTREFSNLNFDGIGFNSDPLIEGFKAFLKSRKKGVTIVSHNMRITKYKVWEYIPNKYKINQNIICFTYKELKITKLMPFIRNYLKSRDLIIIILHDTKANLEDAKAHEVTSYMTNRDKLIILSECEYDSNFKTLIDHTEFKYLNAASRQIILQRTVNFQGNEIPLSYLFPAKKENELCEQFITSSILIHLMENRELICFGGTVEDDEQNFSLPRKLISPSEKIISERNFFSESEGSESKIALISGFTKSGKSVLLINLQKYFRIYCRDEKRFKWIFRVNLESPEAIEELVKLKKLNSLNVRYLFEDALIETVVNLVKNELSHGEFYRLNEQLLKYHMKFNKVVILFDGVDKIGRYVEGFYFLLRQFTRHLMKTQIVITACPHSIDRLVGQGCANNIYSIKRFCNQEQQLLISELWKFALAKNFTENLEKHRKDFEHVALSFIALVSAKKSSLNIGIPWLVHLFRRILLNDFQHYDKYKTLQGDLNILELYEEFCLSEFRSKLKHRLGIPTFPDESVIEELYLKFHKEHEILAVMLLFCNSDLKQMNLHDKFSKKATKVRMRNFMANHYNYNIIANVMLGEPIFLDLSLAQFFLFKYFTRKLQSYKPNDFFICKYFILSMLTDFGSMNLRLFFNEWIRKDSLEKNNLSLLIIRLWNNRVSKEFKKADFYKWVSKIVELSAHEGNYATAEFFLSHLTEELRVRCINEMEIDEHESKILHYAAEHNDFRIVKFLTENKVDIDSKDIWGRSSIYLAIKKGNLEMAKYLQLSTIVEYKYLPRAFIESNLSPELVRITKANFSKEGPWLIKRVLKEFCNEEEMRKVADMRDFNLICCFLLAAKFGNSELLHFLMNQQNASNLSEFVIAENKALLVSTIYGHYNIVETLLGNYDSHLDRVNCGNIALCIACQFGHPDLVRLLLRKLKLSVNSRRNDGESALLVACKYGHLEIVEYLLKAEAKIDLQDNHGNTALMIASREGYAKIVRLLLSRNASVNMANKFSETAVFLASEYNRLDVMKLLLEDEARCDCCNYFDESPLLVSLMHGNDSMRLILKRNTDLNLQRLEKCSAADITMYYSKYTYGYCCSSTLVYEGSLCRYIKAERHPFLFANLHHNKKIVELLVEHRAEIHVRKIRTAFLEAVKGGHNKALEWFLNQKIHCDVDKPGEVALIMAAKDGKIDIVQMLLNAGVSPNCKREQNPVSLAIKHDHNSVANILLKNGVLINTEDKVGETPLFEACRKGNFDYVLLFLQRGTNINLQNRQAETPLLLSASNGHLQIVKLLLDKHADVSKKNWIGQNAVTLAARSGFFDIVKLLLKRGCPVINHNSKTKLYLLLEVLYNGHFDIAKLLISHGADVNVKDLFGVTPLLFAAQYGLIDIAKALLKRKVNIDEKNLNNETPLIMAAGHGHLEIVKLLLQYRAAGSEMNSCEETALFVACKNGHVLVAEYLMQKSLNDLNIPNVDHLTPILVATKSGYLSIIMLLANKNASMQPNIYEETPLFLASCYGYHEIVEYYLDRGGVRVDVVNYEGKTPLFAAAENGHFKCVKILIDKGANVDVATKQTKETALFPAIRYHFMDIIHLLLENYADIDVENSAGETPQMLAHKILKCDLKTMLYKHDYSS